MDGVRIILERDAGVGLEVVNVNVLVDVDDVFSLRVDFDKDLLLTHLFDDFSNVRAWFLEVVEFFAQHADFGVEGVAVGFEALQVGSAALYRLEG